MVRIIGGEYRGRKISFPDAAGLRPTSDRVRETLFNWLQPVIVGARCLDLFAGSGALGFEATSRGAKKVTMIESNPKVAASLKQNAAVLAASNVEVIVDDALAWVGAGAGPYDVVFVDPPFAGKLLAPVLRSLVDNEALSEDALIYLEGDAADGFPGMLEGLELIREKRAGQVCYGLAGKKHSELNRNA